MHAKNRDELFRPRMHKMQRREPRFVVTIPVTVMRYLRFGPSVTEGMSLDISRSGMSVLVCGAPRVGETVVIAPRARTEPVEILASVRHSTDARTGLQFYPLSSVAEKALEKWLKELEQQEAELMNCLGRHNLA